MSMERITKTAGYHSNVEHFMCDDTDGDKPTTGGSASGFANGTTCLNVDEAVEYIAFRETWKTYVTLG